MTVREHGDGGEEAGGNGDKSGAAESRGRRGARGPAVLPRS